MQENFFNFEMLSILKYKSNFKTPTQGQLLPPYG